MDGHVRDCGGLGLFGVRLDRENLFPLLKFVTLPSSRSIFGARDERRTGVLAARTVSVTKGLPRSAVQNDINGNTIKSRNEIVTNWLQRYTETPLEEFGE